MSITQDPAGDSPPSGPATPRATGTGTGRDDRGTGRDGDRTAGAGGAGASVEPAQRRRDLAAPLAAAVLLLALAALMVLSLLVGAGTVSVPRSWDFLLGDPAARADERVRLAVAELRLPRTAVGVLVGACLGAAGALLQAVTRNPLAETGLLGVNSGAALGVVTGLTWFGAATGHEYLLWSFLGALAASAVVLLLAASGRSGAGPLRLVLAGSALGATFHGLTSFVLLGRQASFDEYRYWVVGSLALADADKAWTVLPAVAAGLLIALGCARPLSALALGDDAARALGHRPGAVRVTASVSVTLLTGAAVALAGPVAFLGLLAPYLARTVAGPRTGAQIALSAVVGPVVLLGADILARLYDQPYETPVGVLLALAGGPVLVWIARSRRMLALSTPGGGPR